MEHEPGLELDYCNIERLTPEEIARRRAEFDVANAQAKRARRDAGIVRVDSLDEIGRAQIVALARHSLPRNQAMDIWFGPGSYR